MYAIRATRANDPSLHTDVTLRVDAARRAHSTYETTEKIVTLR
jgi:hypothetical protein